MFQLILRKQFDKLEKELIHCLNTVVCLQVNPIVGHFNFWMYIWKRSQSLIDYNSPENNSTHLVYDFGLRWNKKKGYFQYIQKYVKKRRSPPKRNNQQNKTRQNKTKQNKTKKNKKQTKNKTKHKKKQSKTKF